MPLLNESYKILTPYLYSQLKLAKKNYKKVYDLALKYGHQFLDLFKTNYERVK